MKVTPQIITFIVLVAIGWYSYENYQPFHALVDDIIGYAGMDAETKQAKPPVQVAKEEISSPATKTDKDKEKQLESTDQDIVVTEGGEPSSMDQKTSPVVIETQLEAAEPEQKAMPAQMPEVVETQDQSQPVTVDTDVVDGVKFPPLPETETPEVSKDDQPVDLPIQPDQQQGKDKPIDLNIPVVEKEALAVPKETSTDAVDAVVTEQATAVMKPFAQTVPVAPVEEQMVAPPVQAIPPVDATQPVDKALPSAKDEQQADLGGYRIRTPEEIKALEEEMTSEPPAAIESTERPLHHQLEVSQDTTDTAFKNVPQEQVADVSMYRTDQQPPIAEIADTPEFTEADRELEELFNARDMWQQGDHDLAMKTYYEMMMSYPSNPDFPGELGNIYFSKGLTDQAVDAYTESLKRLLRANDLRRAWNLYSAIKKIAPERAAQLEEYFTQTQN